MEGLVLPPRCASVLTDGCAAPLSSQMALYRTEFFFAEHKADFQIALLAQQR